MTDANQVQTTFKGSDDAIEAISRDFGKESSRQQVNKNWGKYFQQMTLTFAGRIENLAL